MSLVAPLFLLGLGLLALPIWLHRLQTDNPEREPFASTMFLEQSQKRVHVRRQLRYRALMALRLLFLALLVFAFTKPLLQSDAPLIAQANSRMHILVVDTSASMSASGVFEDARAQAESIVSGAGEQDLVELYSFGANLTKLGGPTSNRADLLSVIRLMQPSPTASDNGTMMSALSRFDWSQPLDYQVHIVSDLQKTALPDRYADMIPDLPSYAQISFNFYPVVESDKANWAIDSVRLEEGGLRVSLRGFNTPERSLDLSVSLDRGGQATSETASEIRSTLVVPESGRASVVVPGLEYQASVNAVNVKLLVEDELAADNSYFLAVDRLPPEPVLLLTSNPFGPAATYLSAVMSSVGEVGSASSNSANYRVQATSLSEFDLRTLSRYSWLLIDDIGSIGPQLADALIVYLESGGAVFAALGKESLSLNTLPVTGHSLLPSELANDNRFHAVSQVDRSHVMLNALEGWSDLSFSRAPPIELLQEDKTLVILDNGAPLLVEQKRGQGKLLLLTSSLDNQWNDLPIKPLYVSLMAEVSAYLSNSDSLKTQLFAGDVFSLKDKTGGAGQLVDPQGQAVLSLGNTSELGAHMLDQTGFYEVYTPTGETLIAVNVDPIESDLTSLEESEIQRWMQALRGQESPGAGNEGNSAASSFEVEQTSSNQREIWLAILCLAALMLIAESLFANFLMSNKPVVKRGGYATA